MNKQTKPVPDDDALFGPELSEADIDAWIERNREALNASLQVARDQLARGEVDTRTFEEIIAEGKRRHLAKR
jgi:antitoxin ParD1/3/4